MTKGNLSKQSKEKEKEVMEKETIAEKLLRQYKKLEELNENELNEFKRADAGEKIPFENFHDAVEKLYTKYKENDFFAYCENVLPKGLKYKGQTLELCLVLGGEIDEENGTYDIVCKSGFGHALQHAGDSIKNEIVTEEDLKKAIKQLPNALKYGDRYDETVVIRDKAGKERTVVRLFINYEINRKEYVYIIAFAEDETEVNYLMNTFRPDQGYVQRKIDDGDLKAI